MEKKINSAKKIDKVNDKNCLIAYEISANMLISYGETLWTKFSGLLVANSIMLGLLGFIFRATPASENALNYQFYYSKIVSALGIIISFLSFILIMRSFYYYDFWLFTLKDIENKFFDERIFNKSIIFGKGDKVPLINPLTNKEYKMHWVCKKLRMRLIFYIIIFVFLLLFTLIFFFNEYILQTFI